VPVRLSVLRRPRQRGGSARQGHGAGDPDRHRPLSEGAAIVGRSPDAGTLESLRRVIRRIEQAHTARRTAPEPIEAVVGGTLEETACGPIVTVRREFALDHRHGGIELTGALAAAPELLGVLSRDGVPAGDVRGLLFLDTETTGLAGGTGTYAFLVGVGRMETDRFVVQQFFMRDLDEEPALLAALDPLIASAHGLVTYNGSGFDLPLLETRFILSRRRWQPRWHLDLLRPARRMWGTRLQDCRLATIESRVLGLEREDDVPGALIPALYFDYLRRRGAGALTRVFSHNRADVLSLAAVTAWLARALDPPDDRALAPHDYAGLGRLWERADPERGYSCYRRAMDAGLTGLEAERVRLTLAAWEKRRARWEAARALWDVATRSPVFDPRPWEELAKFYEHRARDLAAARELVLRALERGRAEAAPPRVLDGFEYRLARLARRLSAREHVETR
jgi:uncharacterized protein YprB with RNaseH-like and TPR domain